MAKSTVKFTLQPCCKRSLKQIRDKKEIARVLSAALAASPFVLLMSGSPPSGLITVSSTDWSLLARAIKGIPAIAKERCQTIAGFEAIKHPGGPLHMFWQGLYDSCS